VIGMVNVALLNPAAAAWNGYYEDGRATLNDSSRHGASADTWLRQGLEGGQVVIHGRGRDRPDGVIRLTKVSIFVQTLTTHGALQFDRRIEADQAVLLPGHWRLTGVREVRTGLESVRAESLSLPTTLDGRSAIERFTPPGAVASWDLPATIRSANQAGYSSLVYRLRLQQLLATPVLLAGMTLLAAAFSLRLQRLGDLPALAVTGVAAGFAVFFINQFCGALGATETIPIGLAAWVTPGLAVLSGVTILCYTEDG
jgi:lipopolysaccharide export system permease protein